MTARSLARALVPVFVLLLSSIGLVIVGPPASAEAWVKTDMGMPPGGGNYRYFGVAVGDGDRDGSPEVYFTARQNGGVFQYTYDGTSGNWTIENVAGQGFVADTVVLGDGDDTGDKELYVMGISRGIPRPRTGVYQIFHDSTGWHQADVTTAGSTGNELALGDGNNDNRTEVFGACADGHIYMYYKMGSWNSQDIGYALPPSGQGSTSMEGVAVGDGDNDGRLEVYGSAATGSVYRFGYQAQIAVWNRTDVGQGDVLKSGSNMASIGIGDLDGDGKNEVYGASWANASIYMFKYNGSTSKWDRTTLVSLGTQVSAYGLAIGDGNSDGSAELYAGTSNNQVYMVRHDKVTGTWSTSSVGSGNGPMNDVAVGSAMGVSGQNELYASCGDGHGYQFLIDRTPPANPSVWSDTHAVPGTWYANSVVHVLWKDTGKDPSGIDGYSLSWDSNPATIPDAFKDVEETVHDASSPALSPGTWYFHIRARDNALNWNPAAAHFGPICIGSAPDITPPMISDVQVSGITDKLAVVSWSTNEPADGSVEFGSTDNYGLRAWDTAFVLSHSVTLTGLSASTTYHLRVASKDASGNGPTQSGDYTFTTQAAPDVTPPVISNVKVGGITDRLAVVTWETDEPADSAVDFGPTAGYGMTATDGKFVKLHEVTLSGLNASTVYHFRVRSRDVTGNGPAASADQNFTTMAQPDRTPPRIMNARAEAITQTSATIQWETDEVADSFVEYGLTSSYGSSTVEKGLTASHSMQLQGLVADKTYHFRVMSADSSGNTGMGTDMVFRTAKTPSQPDKDPPVISGLVVSGITNTRAVVMWMTDELADSAVDHGRTASYGLRASDAAFVVVHSVVLENLSPMTEYHVRARSTDVSGNGPTLSADLKFTTISTPDSSPPGITAIKVVNLTKNSALITWVTDEPSSSVVDFGNDTQYGQHMSSPVFVLQHSVMLTGLKTGATYHFKVSSTDPSGNAAPPSADQSFRTLKSSGTGGAGATPPWLWLFVILIIVVIIVGGYWAYRGLAPTKKELAAQAAARPSAVAAAVRQMPLEDERLETIEMEGAGAGRAEAPRPAPRPMAYDAPRQGPASQTTAYAAPQPAPQVPLRHIRCPKCRARVPIYVEGPHKLTCPNCGKSGLYKPKAVGPGPTAANVRVAGPPPVPEPEPVAPAPGEGPARVIRCSGCGSEVPIYTTVFPIRITCPRCGRSGIYRGPKA